MSRIVEEARGLSDEARNWVIRQIARTPHTTAALHEALTETPRRQSSCSRKRAAGRAYWYAMTPAQRHAEGLRRWKLGMKRKARLATA